MARALEGLEDRTVLSTIDISGGVLTYLETTSPGTPNFLTVSTTGLAGTYTFAETLQNITLGSGAVAAGWTASGMTAQGPDSSVNSISITRAGASIVNLYSVSDPTTIELGAGTSALNIGNAGDPSGVQAPISARATGGSAALLVDASAGTSAQTFAVSTSQVSSSTLTNPITLGTGITGVILDSGSGDDRFDILAPGTSLQTYTVDGDGGTNVLDLHSAQSGLDYSVPGVIAGSSLLVDYSNLATIHITAPSTAPVGTGVALDSTEAHAFTNKVVASFTESDPGAGASDFVASINWGDSTPSTAGAILANGTTGFDVLGNHVYENPGTYTVSVTVTDLGTSASATVGNTFITVTSTASVPVTITSTADVATATLAAQGAPVSGYERLTVGNFPTVSIPPASNDVLVATFTDGGTIGGVADYTASIHWGDGSSASAATRIVEIGTPNGVVFQVYGTHTYAMVGSYPVVTTITKATDAFAVATSTATIADAPLTAIATSPISTTEGVYFNGTVGSFRDANPGSLASDFLVTIDWGDGSPQTVGYVTGALGSQGVTYVIRGTHTYSDSLPIGKPGSGVPGPQDGTYPITIHVADVDGSRLVLTNTANVADDALTLGGHLNPASDSGVSSSDAITNVRQPNFVGTASEGFAKISLYATASGGGLPTLIGQTTADSTGSWNITPGAALADGSYSITAQAIDSSDHTLSTVTTITSQLVIDTAGPKVAKVLLDRIHGTVTLTTLDLGGQGNSGVGLNQNTLIDANNYVFSLIYSPFNPRRVPKFLVSGLSTTPGTTAGEQVTTVTINNGKYLRGGHFLFTARSVSPTNLTGVQDIAGNAFDSEFYGYFPSGNNSPGGDFVAELDAVHHKVYAPRTVIGKASPVSPPGTPGTSSTIPTYQPGRTVRVTAAARHSASKADKLTTRTAAVKTPGQGARTLLAARHAKAAAASAHMGKA